MITRRKFLKSIFYAGTAFVLYDGYKNTKSYQITYRNIKNNQLSSPLKIVHISDTHFKSSDKKKAEKLSRDLNKQNPSMVFLTGDYLKMREYKKEIEIFNYFLNQIECGNVFASLGNWDFGIETQIRNNKNLTLLENSGAYAEINNNKVFIYGNTFGSKINSKKIKKEYKNLESTISFLLSHSPDDVVDMDEYIFDFAFSGHTHGGQIIIPPIKPFYIPSKYGYKYFYGEFNLGKTKLFVTSGIGVSSVPFRLNSPAEINVLNLS